MDADVNHIEFENLNLPYAVVDNISVYHSTAKIVDGHIIEVDLPDLSKDSKAKVNVSLKDLSPKSDYVKKVDVLREYVDDFSPEVTDRVSDKVGQFMDNLLVIDGGQPSDRVVSQVSDSFVELFSDTSLLDYAKVHTNIMKRYSAMMEASFSDYRSHPQDFSYTLADHNSLRLGVNQDGSDLTDDELQRAMPMIQLENLGMFSIMQSSQEKPKVLSSDADISQLDPFGTDMAQHMYRTRQLSKSFSQNYQLIDDTIAYQAKHNKVFRTNLNAFTKEIQQQRKITDDLYVKAFDTKVMVDRQISHDILNGLDKHIKSTNQLISDLQKAFASKDLPVDVQYIDLLDGVVPDSQKHLPQSLQKDLPGLYRNWKHNSRRILNDVSYCVDFVNNNKKLAEDYMDVTNPKVFKNYKDTIDLGKTFVKKLRSVYNSPVLGDDFAFLVTQEIPGRSLAYFYDDNSLYHKDHPVKPPKGYELHPNHTLVNESVAFVPSQSVSVVSRETKSVDLSSIITDKQDASQFVTFAVNDLSAKFRQTSDPELRKAVVMLRDFHQRLNSNQNSEKKQFISTVEQVYNKIEGKSGSFQSLLASYKDHKLDNAQPEIVYESKSTDRAKLNVR